MTSSGVFQCPCCQKDLVLVIDDVVWNVVEACSLSLGVCPAPATNISGAPAASSLGVSPAPATNKGGAPDSSSGSSFSTCLPPLPNLQPMQTFVAVMPPPKPINMDLDEEVEVPTAVSTEVPTEVASSLSVEIPTEVVPSQSLEIPTEEVHAAVSDDECEVLDPMQLQFPNFGTGLDLLALQYPNFGDSSNASRSSMHR
jgi:hypothetical protein